MFQRKLYKACLVIGSLVFMSVASGNGSYRKLNGINKPVACKDSTHHFDSSGLCTCIPFTVKDNAANAPRIQLNKNVAGFVKKYNKENGYFIGKAGSKVARHFGVVNAVLIQEGLPGELKYLAFIESGLKRNFKYYSGAVGPWSLMPVAARQYGLKVSAKNDERLDYYKSTKAAAALLSDLYDQYQDWLLVIAAYNSGPGWIDKAIKRSGSRNYWVLQKYLPKETQSHIKRFIAVHYYFEGHGSLTTMTKAETEAHVKAVEEFMDSQQKNLVADSVAVVSSK